MPDRTMHLEKVSQWSREGRESSLVLGQTRRLAQLFAKDDLMIDQVKQPFMVVAQAGMPAQVAFDPEFFASARPPALVGHNRRNRRNGLSGRARSACDRA